MDEKKCKHNEEECECKHEHHHEDGHCCHNHEHHHEDGHCCHNHEHHHEEGHCCHNHEHNHEDGHCCHNHEHEHEEQDENVIEMVDAEGKTITTTLEFSITCPVDNNTYIFIDDPKDKDVCLVYRYDDKTGEISSVPEEADPKVLEFLQKAFDDFSEGKLEKVED